MVQDPGTTVRPHRLRPLAGPVRIPVRPAADGAPATVVFEGEERAITAVQDRWRIDDEWWRETPVTRMYYQLQLDGGRVITLYRDLDGGTWWLQRY